MAQLAMTAVGPALTTDEARKTAPLMTVVGSWTTHFIPGISNYWGKNISIPAAAIDGYVVAPGAWFDFWKVVGMPTLADGYGMGGAIINGHTEETGAIAGGICSTSTTLFNAALRAGYEIGERANHYYYISRYPVGLDATVAMGTGWEQDMTWRNDTAYPVLIHALNGPGTVTFQLYSVDPHRTVTLSTPIVKNYTYATTQYVKVTTLTPGPGEPGRVRVQRVRRLGDPHGQGRDRRRGPPGDLLLALRDGQRADPGGRRQPSLAEPGRQCGPVVESIAQALTVPARGGTYQAAGGSGSTTGLPAGAYPP